MKRIYIADINSLVSRTGEIQGHYRAVFENWLDIFRAVADVRIAAGPTVAKQFSQCACVLPCESMRGSTWFLNKLKNLINMRILLHRAQGDVIVFQSSALAMVWLGIALFADCRTRIFVINYTAEMSCFASLMYAWAKRKITGNICTMKEVAESLGVKAFLVPDYLYVKPGIPRLRSEEKMNYDYAIVGIINQSKGVLEVARRFVGCKSKVLIAGRIVDDALGRELTTIASNNINIVYQPGYLEENALAGIISTTRAVILNYSDDYSKHTSGVVYDILFKGCPVIGRRCAALEFVGENCLGCLYKEITDLDPDVFIRSFDRLSCEKRIGEYLKTHAHLADELRAFILGDAS